MRGRLRERVLAALLFVAAMAGSSEFALASDRESASKPNRYARNFEGIWTSGTLTPIERPAEFANKPTLTAAEMTEYQRRSTERFWEAGHRAGEIGRDYDAFLDNDLKILANGQTSLIVDPPDGKIPLRPEAERARDFNLSNFDSYETMSQYDRCITRQPLELFPQVYNNAYQIVQTPKSIVVVTEMVHDARTIPTDGSAHIDGRVRSWGGDSRGHWERDTLVVDTTNFNGNGWLGTVSNTGRARGVPFSKDLHIVERFTRVDANTLNYEIVIDDPQYFKQPWKMSYPMKLDNSYRMYEYACHEGNTAVESILRGARVQEQAKAAR
jgi:hypothetical protein